MPPLRIEIHRDNQWVTAGTIKPGDRYGSISDNSAEGRAVYFFGVDQLEGKAVVKRSELGADEATSSTRIIHGIGETSVVAELDPGESYEMTVTTDASQGVSRLLRFTHLSE